MPLAKFKKADLVYFKRAFEQPAHTTLDEVDFVLGTQTRSAGVSRAVRAVMIVDFATRRTKSDDILLAALNAVYFEHFTEEERQRSEVFMSLRRNVLGPRGVRYDGNEGFQFEVGHPIDAPRSPSLDRAINRPRAEITEEDIAARMREMYPSNSKGRQLAASGQTPVPKPSNQPRPASAHPNTVFIVQGRDSRPVAELEDFLAFLRLDIITWDQARGFVDAAQPTTFEVVKAGLDHAGAVLVLFTPDEYAELRAELSGEMDDNGNPIATEQGYQARQNVTLEAGLAFGLAPKRTIFVWAGGAMRSITDIHGFNSIRMDGSWEQRKALMVALEKAGLTPRAQHENLEHNRAGAFRVDPWPASPRRRASK